MKGLAKYKGLALLALLVLIAPLLTYRYAVSGTVRQWRETGKCRRQIEQLRSSSAGQGKNPEVETGGKEMIMSGVVIAELLPLIEAEKLKIEHFAPYTTSSSDGIVLTTGQISLQGRYTGIVRLIDRMEREMPQCKIISAHYRSTKPRNRNSVKTLSCTIYIQQITTNDQIPRL